MRKDIIPALSVTAWLAALCAGCALEPRRPPAPEPEAARAEEPVRAPERKPCRAGDSIVYPLQWRNAGETAYRLYALFWPKYGPYLQIVPDPHTNSLLIYVPPREARFPDQGVDRRRPGDRGP